jgi:hypothetical protein
MSVFKRYNTIDENDLQSLVQDAADGRQSGQGEKSG